VLPSFYSEKIQYDNPNTLEDFIKRAKHLYEKSRGMPFFEKYWNDKMKGKTNQRKNKFKHPFQEKQPIKIERSVNPK
jgi:hypothetical protein